MPRTRFALAATLDSFERSFGDPDGVTAGRVDHLPTRSAIRGCSGGVDSNGTAAKPRLDRCLQQSNATQAIANVRLDAVPFITWGTPGSNPAPVPTPSKSS